MPETTDYKELISEVKKYVTLQVDYTKFSVVEKMVILLSATAVAAIVGVFAICALFFITQALVFLLGSAMNCLWGAYLIIGAFYLVVMVIVIALKKTLVIDPIARFLSKLFLNPKK